MSAYVGTVRLFLARYGRVNEKSLCDYKVFLLEHYKPKTVNLRLHAINKYLEFLHADTFKIKGVKDPQRAFLENVISDADYRYLKQKLKEACMTSGISPSGSWAEQAPGSANCSR